MTRGTVEPRATAPISAASKSRSSCKIADCEHGQSIARPNALAAGTGLAPPTLGSVVIWMGSLMGMCFRGLASIKQTAYPTGTPRAQPARNREWIGRRTQPPLRNDHRPPRGATCPRRVGRRDGRRTPPRLACGEAMARLADDPASFAAGRGFLLVIQQRSGRSSHENALVSIALKDNLRRVNGALWSIRVGPLAIPTTPSRATCPTNADRTRSTTHGREDSLARIKAL